MLTPNSVIALFAWLIGLFLMWRVPSLAQGRRAGGGGGEEAVDAECPSISVIIPARNESRRIAPLLESLGQQAARPFEVIVVDDHSTDGTAAVAEGYGVTLIQSQALPNGWTGKTWACWQGARRAAGELLLFLDADTWLEPGGLAALVRAYVKGGGLLTVQPYHVTCRPYEELSAFFSIVLMAGLNAFTPLGESIPPGGGFGPCVLCAKADYARAGGHRDARSGVLESISLARLFLKHGLPVRCYGGRGGVSFRMYPGGLGQLVEGWSKGFGTGALSIRWPFLLLAVAWVTGCFATGSVLLRALLSPGTRAILPPALLYGAYVLQIRWMLARIGSFRWWTAILFPLPLCFFALVMLRSLVMIHLLGRVSWRGRTVATARRDDAGGDGDGDGDGDEVEVEVELCG